MLWRVQNTDKYFLGSMHLLPEHDSELDTRILGLLPQMSRVVFESDLSNPKVPDFATYQDGRQLHHVIPADLYTKCTQRWSELGIQASLDSCKPWWAGLLITIATAMKNGFSNERGVDKQLFGNVSYDRMTYLEAPDAPLLAWERAPILDQVLYLKLCCAEEESIMAELMSLHAAWRASDLTALLKILDKYMAMLPSTYTALVADRNRVWAPEIVKYLADPNPTLFVLGALHYVGSSKLPECLDGKHEYVFENVF